MDYEQALATVTTMTEGQNLPPEKISWALNLVTEEVRNYCRIEEVPAGLQHTVERATLELYHRMENQGKTVTSVSEGDSSVSYSVMADDVLSDYRRQLNRYRKVGTI